MKLSLKEQSYLEGTLLPEAKFLSQTYALTLFHYQWASQFAKSKIVLDAGFGAGHGAAEIAKNGASKVFAIDSNPETVKYAKERYQEKNLEFHEGDVTNINFPDNYFDLIIAFEVIEHIRNYELMLSEFLRILKPGGKLILSTPNKALYSPGTDKPFYPFHQKEFYIDDLRKALYLFKEKEVLGVYIKGERLLLYPNRHPKKFIRIFYANLPFFIKIHIMKFYLKVLGFCYEIRVWRPREIDPDDVFLSKDVNHSREILAIYEK